MMLHRPQPHAGGSLWVRQALRIEWRFFITDQAFQHQKAVGGDTQAGVMMETAPVAVFMVSQPQFLLQSLVIAFDPPYGCGA